MDKAKRYFGKGVFYLFKFLVVPFFAFFCGFFFLFGVLGEFSESIAQTTYLSIVIASSILSLFFAIIIFATYTTASFPVVLRRSERISLFLRKHFPKTKRISIETRIELKTYLLVIAVSLFLVFLSILIKFSQTKTAPQLSSIDYLVLFTPYVLSLMFILGWARCYTTQEKITFLLERFYLNEPRRGLSGADFENALKTYQGTLSPIYSFSNLKERMKQLQLILDRGTKEEILRIQLLVFSLSSSVEIHDESSFDNCFTTLCQFIEQKGNEKRSVLKINESRKERFRSLMGKVSTTFSDKALPILLLAFLLYIIYLISGIKITIA